MKTIKQFSVLVLLLTVSFSLFAQKNFVILHTNDTHSRIEPLPETDRSFPDKGGVVRRDVYINQVREAEKNVLLFDAGDFLQGTPYFNMFKGEAEIETMNLLQYDAVTLGNHEFDYGMEVLDKVVQLASFPVVSSNYDFSQTSLANKIEPFIIINRDGVRIGVIAVNIQPKGLIASENYKGVKYLDPASVANELATFLKSKKRCDFIVCLSHLGYRSDLELAKETRNIDLIIGGHSHTYMAEPEFIKDMDNNDVMIFQTNGRGVYVGRIDVEFEKKSK